MIMPITMITAIMPTTAPALKIPAIAEQLLSRIAISKMAAGAMIFFIEFYWLACAVIILQVAGGKALCFATV